MKLTREQKEIIESKGDIKINAVAGSGKTTTLIEYAKFRSKNSRILYLAFNKTIQKEAQKKFRSVGLDNVTARTAHSLAYKYVVKPNNKKYKVNQNGYKVSEIVDILNLRIKGNRYYRYIFAKHILNFIGYYCNHEERNIRNINYLNTLERGTRIYSFLQKYYPMFESLTRRFLRKMDDGKIGITHDFYLKKFQLLNPQLKYDYILFDEGQDASGAMLNVFLKQKATKVIVGDTHQQIYSWRYAVNSLEKVSFKQYSLTKSFRFPNEIAQLAKEVITWKKYIGKESLQFSITGTRSKVNTTKKKSSAIIARTNISLLKIALEFVTLRIVNKIYFEGNFKSYFFAKEGTSLNDVMKLSKGNIKQIKNKLIRELGSMENLREYISQTNDIELSMMLKLIDEYGNDLLSHIDLLKKVQVNSKHDAQLIFSTVHKCKGMEYDYVRLADDFIKKDKLEALFQLGKIMTKRQKGKEKSNNAKLNEEINILYVAITRAKYKVTLPFDFLPRGYPKSTFIDTYESHKFKISHRHSSNNTNLNVREYAQGNKISNVNNTHPRSIENISERVIYDFIKGANIPKLMKEYDIKEEEIDSIINNFENRNKIMSYNELGSWVKGFLDSFDERETVSETQLKKLIFKIQKGVNDVNASIEGKAEKEVDMQWNDDIDVEDDLPF